MSNSSSPPNGNGYNSTEQLIVREHGVGQPPMPPVGELPAGGAVWPVQHYQTKIGLINQISRSYRWTYDEALKHSRQNAVAMLRDPEIRDALETRWIPTTQLQWHLEPQDPTDPRQQEACKKLEGIIRQTPRLQDVHKSLLWAIWYGRAGIQFTYEWDFSHPDGERRLKVKDHRPINGDTLVARWSGDWGLLVNSMYDGPKEPSDQGFAHFYTPKEKEAVLVHMHNPEDNNFFEPELAGQVRGSGVRGHVYWYWWLASNFMALAEDFSERFAFGIWKAYFDETNPAAETAIEVAVAGYQSNHILKLPRNKQTEFPVNDVTMQEVGTASPQFLMDIVQYLRDKIRKYITGSNISIDTDVSMGGDAIGVDEDRVSRIIKYDAERLGEMYSVEWLPVLTKYNCGPTIPPPRWVFACDKPNAGALLNYAKALKDLGGNIDLDPLYAACGISQGNPGDNISSNIQPMQPVAVDQAPQGVPSAPAAAASAEQQASQGIPATVGQPQQ